MISDKLPYWQLEIYGKSSAEFDLNAQIKALDLGATVKLYKPTRSIQEKYLDASIYALPSRSEGFGMVLIEAMACGLPCVAFDCPSGPADIIRDNEDGFLIENAAISAFAKKLELLMKNETLRLQMGAKAYQNVLRYQPDTVVKQWDELFKELINK
jgi:glycosyltransferase involved in cell wall biosynthesis